VEPEETVVARERLIDTFPLQIIRDTRTEELLDWISGFSRKTLLLRLDVVLASSCVHQNLVVCPGASSYWK
jgi:hypothetical protein